MFRVLAVSVLLVCLVPSSGAPQAGKVWRIGYLTSQLTALDSRRREAIRQALRAFGYIEGQNILFEYRSAEGNLARLPGLAAELVSLKVDVILVAGGYDPILEAKNATRTIPIVMTGGGTDPVESGMIDSLASPGGNITGYINIAGYLGGKRLELLKEAVAKVARVAVLYEANNRRNMLEFKEVLPASARALKLTLLRHEVRDANDFDRVFAAINKDRPDGISVLGGPLMQRSHDGPPPWQLRAAYRQSMTSAKRSMPVGSCSTARTSWRVTSASRPLSTKS